MPGWSAGDIVGQMPETIRILTADDHHLIRAGVSSFLATEPGLKVVAEAANGEEALEKYREVRPDLVFMDLSMPVMNGIEATRAILEEFPDARIVALTTYAGDEDIHRAIQAGAAAYLLKDTVPEVLVQVIRDVHGGRRVFPPQIIAAIERRAGQPALTSRELEVLELLAAGKRTKEIATTLGVTMDTANAHIKNIYSKFSLHGRTAVVAEAIKRGFIRRERNQ